MPRALILANLALLIVFPLSWFAPIMRAGLLPLFGLDEISILSGIAALWEDAPALSVLVALLALAAPMAKTLALFAIHMGRLSSRWLPAVTTLGKLAMADIFLVAVYITVARGLAIGRIETAWGLWLFTAAVLASYAVSLATDRLAKAGRLG
ncbi:paraquat-inducible membrane protein A [Rhodobacterales bacterium HKCCE3408]|nr:paraquat-inducible membrane protein A [Rhodobacterales bacterium HKCCE3408]